jgi:hypothetical protein
MLYVSNLYYVIIFVIMENALLKRLEVSKERLAQIDQELLDENIIRDMDVEMID